jgi:tight adherence protein B
VRHRHAARRRLAALEPNSPTRRQVPLPFDRYPMWTLLLSAAVAGGTAGFLGGPVAAVVAVCYTAYAVRSLRRAVSERRAARARTVALDVIGGLAADLRAGIAAPAALSVARRALEDPDPAVRRARDRVDAACEVSERLGAPLADLLDRVESDLRAAERARTAVAAQTGGARASAVLLALLPVAGVALGYAMGAQPDHALLHTPLGAGCVIAALLLQCAGMAWTGRMCRAAVERASGGRPRAASPDLPDRMRWSARWRCAALRTAAGRGRRSSRRPPPWPASPQRYWSAAGQGLSWAPGRPSVCGGPRAGGNRRGTGPSGTQPPATCRSPWTCSPPRYAPERRRPVPPKWSARRWTARSGGGWYGSEPPCASAPDPMRRGRR